MDPLNDIGASKGQTHSQETLFGLYRNIYDKRHNSSDTDWATYRQALSSCIAANCNRLRNEKVRELPADSIPSPFENGAIPTPATSNSDGSSLPPSPSPPPDSSDQQNPVNESTATDGAVQSQQLLQPSENPAAGPITTVAFWRYTSVLKEHADIHGGVVDYQRTSLSDYPPSWHITATFRGFSGQGIGRNSTQAKHAASKQLCESMGLSIL
jgi:hypothetical protein